MLIFSLPNNKKLYISECVLKNFKEYIQVRGTDSESGGFLVGYQNMHSDSIIVENISVPQKHDEAGPTYFILKDQEHFEELAKFEANQSYLLGTWHTHLPQLYNYSSIDHKDWLSSLDDEITAGDYYIYIILVGTEIRVWAGDKINKIIHQLNEFKGEINENRD